VLGVGVVVGVARMGAGRDTPRAEPPIPGDWKLTFADEFNGTSIDRTKWRANWQVQSAHRASRPVNAAEAACYDPRQVSVGGGVAKLSLAKSTCRARGATYPYRSGLIRSHRRFTYGYFEARMRLPHAAGRLVDWPAFWANGTGVWPLTGEIDVVEGSRDELCWHFHYSGGAHGGCTKRANSGDWHTFGANWQPHSLTFYYDGAQVGKVKRGVTDKPMYLVANLGISNSHGGPISAPATLQLDYVRIWEY
jgi:beta-glucanase (GH16 family)